MDTAITATVTEEADQSNEEKLEPSTENSEKVEEDAIADVEAPATVSAEKHRRAQLVVEALKST